MNKLILITHLDAHKMFNEFFDTYIQCLTGGSAFSACQQGTDYLSALATTNELS